jgi:hypothetical protein
LNAAAESRSTFLDGPRREGPRSYGGLYGDGTVFKLTPPASGDAPADGGWTKTVLYDFPNSPDQWPPGPDSPLLIRHGSIYGTTGNLMALSGGAIFKLAPPGAPGGAWTMSVLHQFGSLDVPYGTLVMGTEGSIYGTTGGVFSTTPLVTTAYRIEP